MLGGGGDSIYPWVGFGPAPHPLTLFKTIITDFSTLFYGIKKITMPSPLLR